MRISILFTTILALAGCSESSNTSISPATSLQPVVASLNEPDLRKVERLINDLVEACIIHNDGQLAVDPMRPNSTVRYLRERGYYTGFFDPNPQGKFQKIYAEDAANGCGTSFRGRASMAEPVLVVSLMKLGDLGYQSQRHKNSKKPTFHVSKAPGFISEEDSIGYFIISVWQSGDDAIVALWTSNS